MHLLGLHQGNGGSPFAVQKSTLAALCALGLKEGWRRRGARLPGCSLSANTMALWVRKGFKEQQEDSLQEAVLEKCSCYCFSSLLCLLSSGCFLSAPSNYTNSIDLILSGFRELFE